MYEEIRTMLIEMNSNVMILDITAGSSLIDKDVLTEEMSKQMEPCSGVVLRFESNKRVKNLVSSDSKSESTNK